MEYSLSWEADNSMGSQEIAYNVWNFTTHYHVHNSLPLVPILHTLPYYYCKYPSIPVSSKWSPFLHVLPPQQVKILYAFLFSPFMRSAPSLSFSLIWSPEQTHPLNKEKPNKQAQCKHLVNIYTTTIPFCKN